MTVVGLQTLSVFLVDMSRCYFHLAGSLEDICSELYHLIREVERDKVRDKSVVATVKWIPSIDVCAIFDSLRKKEYITIIINSQWMVEMQLIIATDHTVLKIKKCGNFMSILQKTTEICYEQWSHGLPSDYLLSFFAM